MEISVDISLYPLKEAYEAEILEFIAKLEEVEGLDLVRNELSTQIHGEYELVFDTLHRLCKAQFLAEPHSIFTIKLVGNNRKGKLGISS